MGERRFITGKRESERMPEELTEEDLKNMSPEQIRELQKQQCVFCKIAEGQIQAKKVYEDDTFLGVLDINPAAPGHVLLFPKEHVSILPQMPEPVVAKLGIVTKHVSQGILKAMKAQGTSIFVANGLAAGQRSAHFLLHVIPRMEGDEVGITLPEANIEEANAKKLQTALQPFVDRVFGISAKPAAQSPPKTAPVKKEPARTNLDDVTEFLTKK